MEVSWLNVAILVGFLVVFVLTVVSIYIRIHIQGVLFDPYEQSGKNLAGYYAIVTGGNSGIGFESARHLALHGCHVVIACRSAERGNKAASKINNLLHDTSANLVVHKGGTCKFMQCDLSDLESVSNFFKAYQDTKYPCHILLNNAGMNNPKSKFTRKDNLPMVWQINYLAHFYLTHLMLPLLLKTAVQSNVVGRIINVSSNWHKFGLIDFEKYYGNDEEAFKKGHTLQSSYGDSKLAQIMHATYLQSQLFNKYELPLVATSLHPGGVDTNIFKWDKMPLPVRLIRKALYPWFLFVFRTQVQGAQTSLFCAIADIASNDASAGYGLVPGAYHVNCNTCFTEDKAQQSTNAKAMKRLWQYSYKVLKLNEITYDTKTQQFS